MIAQALLSLLLAGVLVYAWVEYRRSPLVSILAVIAALLGLYFVWVPSDSTRIAAFVGIGRGADLILYLWICISLVVLLNLHLKLRRQQELITRLTRTIALGNVPATAEDRPRQFIAQLQQEPAPAGPAQTSRQMPDRTA